MKDMFSKILRIFGLSILALFLVSGVYLGKLYRETTAVFESLRPEIKQADDASQAELFINRILFDKTRKTQATPAVFIARTAVDTQPRNMFDYQMKMIILATRIENAFTDEQILSYWLSTAYLGGGEYGLETAARSLFGKSADALTKDELIALATLIEYPAVRADPVKWDEAQNRLQDRMMQRNKAP